MNKKWLLGLGGIAAISLPVSTVVACTPSDDKKTALVSTRKIENISAPIEGSKNSYTLTFVEGTDTADKTVLETALKGMVAKESDDTKTITFTGSWDTAFDSSKDARYTYTVKAEGYNSVIFVVTVTGNAQKAADDKTKQDAAQNLTKAKSDAKAFVNGLTYPTQDDALHDASLFGAIATTKQAAIAAIEGTTTAQKATAMASSATEGTEITKVISAIDAYNKSTGTDAANLRIAKDTAIGFVNGIELPTQNDGLYDASLFSAIKTAKQAAIDAINAATKEKVVSDMASSTTAGSEITKVISAIDAYNKSTGTIKKQSDRAALVEAINFAIGFVNGIALPTQNDGLYDASLFGAIKTAKQAAIDVINTASKEKVVSDMASSTTAGSEITKVISAIDAYNKSTGTIKKQSDRADLVEAINFAKGIFDGILSRAKPGHDLSLLPAIHATYQAGIKVIESNAKIDFIKHFFGDPKLSGKSKEFNDLVEHYLTTNDSTKTG